MSRGRHSWKMKGHGSLIFGVSTKPSPTSYFNDHNKVAYCWSNYGSAYFRDGVQFNGEVGSYSDDDVVRLDLHCERHTLQITNLRTGRMSTMTNLPAQEYFQYVAMGSTRSVEFVE